MSEEQPKEVSNNAKLGDDFQPVRRHELVFEKEGHRYVFRYEAGEEQVMLDTIERMVAKPDSPLSWYDAAMLSGQLGRNMQNQLKQITP